MPVQTLHYGEFHGFHVACRDEAIAGGGDGADGYLFGRVDFDGEVDGCRGYQLE